jgi:hypothetical protein
MAKLAGAVVVTAALAIAVAPVASGHEPIVSAGDHVALDLPIDGPAQLGTPATRVVIPAEPGDLVAAFNVGPPRPELVRAFVDAAESSGGAMAILRTAMLGLVAVTRNGTTIQAAPANMQYPLVVATVPSFVVGGVFGPESAAAISGGGVVMGATTAGLRGANVGDRLRILGGTGAVVEVPIALIADDAVVGGAEVIMSDEMTGALGPLVASRVLVFGFGSRSGVESALAAAGVDGFTETRVIRSWDQFDPDTTLTVAQTKAALGEFAYRQGRDGSIAQEQAWAAANLPPGPELLNETIRIRARCHLAITEDLRAALAEIAAAGLAAAIDVANSNSMGGCHYPRLNRIGVQYGTLSRHSWGGALDINTEANCQGCVPRLNCDVVRIFRRHGFAWGGNFTRADGMHFEWVGEPRDQIQYRSRYCPNEPSTNEPSLNESSTNQPATNAPSGVASASVTESVRSVMIAPIVG